MPARALRHRQSVERAAWRVTRNPERPIQAIKGYSEKHSHPESTESGSLNWAGAGVVIILVLKVILNIRKLLEGKILEYTVVAEPVAFGETVFIQKVNKMINQGWIPLGGVSVDKGVAFQAMTRQK